MSDSEFPSLVEQGKNLAKTVADVTRNVLNKRGIFATEEIKQERLKICDSCEWINTEKINKRCRVCGCFVFPKASIILEECPKGKWPKLEED